MYADNTLTPKEAIRLCALGSLAQQSMHYSQLAASVRHFISRLVGPQLELMGTSIELLRFEGLVEGVGGVGMEDDAELKLTDKGWEELRTLMVAPVRASFNDITMLIVTLKFRFMHLLEARDRCEQAELLIETCEAELGRLVDLRQHHADDSGLLVSWLDHDIEEFESRLEWLEAFRDECYAELNGAAD